MGALGYYSSSPLGVFLPSYALLLAVGFMLGLGFGFAGVRRQPFVALGYPAAIAGTVVVMGRLYSHGSGLFPSAEQFVLLFGIAALPTIVGSALGALLRCAAS